MNSNHRDAVNRDAVWPRGFLWGSATAAAQIEGAAHEDGKEDSIWDHFARLPGAIAGGDTPETAVDHYHRMPVDVAIMKQLGLDSYRFSTSWARVKPGDRGVNRAGLDFYSRLVDELLEADILPWLTLYHWDLPQSVQEVGGWANRDTAFRFLDYAVSVHEALGDRVTHWTTFNEPLCSSLIGYASGEHAPGMQDPHAALAAVHHQHLAHGLAVRALRERGIQQSRELKLGITLNLTNAVPNDPGDPVDLEAARRLDALTNRMYLDPILRGSYPADLLEDVAEYGLAELVQDGDLAVIAAPIDFLGVNHYHDDNVSGHPLPAVAEPGLVPTDRPTRSPFIGSEYVTFPTRHLPQTAMGWEVNPLGFAGCWCASARSMTASRPCTSPRTARPTTTSSATTDPCTTWSAPDTSSTTSGPLGMRSHSAQTSGATSCGPCSTTSSGPGATTSASASSASTTTPSCAR